LGPDPWGFRKRGLGVGSLGGARPLGLPKVGLKGSGPLEGPDPWGEAATPARLAAVKGSGPLEGPDPWGFQKWGLRGRVP